MKRHLELVGEAAEAVEFVVFAVLAGLLVAIGPVIWVYRLLANHHGAAATVVAVCWLGSVVAIAREVRNKAITALSLALFLAWLILLAYVFHDSLFRSSFP